MTSPPADVAVLGATGFIGSRLCNHLASAGISVRGVTRHPVSEHSEWRPHVLPSEPNPDDWISAVDGVPSVINLVGLAHLTGPDHDVAQGLVAANVVTTAAIARACAKASVQRVIYLSSIKAVAECSYKPLASSDPPSPTTTYGGTKLAGELLTVAGASVECNPTIVRVPLVYGVGARGNLARIARGVRRGMPFPRPSREGLRSLASLERVVLALQGLATTERPPPLVHVCDPEPVVFSDIVQAVADGLGLPVRLVPLPTALLTLALGATGRPDVVRRWTQDLVVHGDEFENHPPTASRAGTLGSLSSASPTFV